MKKIELIKLMESVGYIMPTDEQSVENFENLYKKEIETINPPDWDNPLAILERGFVNEIKFNEDISSYSNMAQAAREGKQISEEMRKKMMNDRNKLND
jgi:hypothetical protein